MRFAVTGVQATTSGYNVQYNVLAGEPEQIVYNGAVSLDSTPTLFELGIQLLADVKANSPTAYIHYLFERVNRSLP